MRTSFKTYISNPITYSKCVLPLSLLREDKSRHGSASVFTELFFPYGCSSQPPDKNVGISNALPTKHKNVGGPPLTTLSQSRQKAGKLAQTFRWRRVMSAIFNHAA